MEPGACLDEDDLLGIAEGRTALADGREAHLASCAECSALLAGAVRARAPRRAWGALVGTQLGHYAIEAQIGEGGMGAVYRARDTRLGRAVAIKVLHENSAALATEARAAAAIDHRAIVAIYDVGTADDGTAYVAMELVEGETLRSAIGRGPLGIARTHALVRELADGLAAAHARGIVHRDLKPENLVLAKDGLRILDFGLAHAHTDAADAPIGTHGTVGYMAPEQLRAEPSDARADLFATGAIAFELATGRRAFPGDTRAERVRATLEDAPAVDTCGALAPVIERCLAKVPGDRFQSAADLAWALRVPAPAAAPRRPSRRAILVGGVAALATGALGFIVGRRRDDRAVVAPPPPRAPETPRPLTHRVGRVSSARFTHDGSRLLYGAAWDGAPIAIHALDLATNESIALDLPAAEILAISERDDLAISTDHRFVDHQSSRGSLAVVPLAGHAAPRAYADDVQEADFLGPADLVTVRPDPAGGYRIEHPLGTTLVREPGWITSPRVAPDGKRLAYFRHPQSNEDGGDLVIVDLAAGSPRTLSTGWTSLAGLVWAPAGDALWFAGSKSDLTTTLQRIAPDDAAGTVTPRTVQISNRIRLHDIAHDGRLAVTGDAWRLRAIVGDTDRSQSDVSYVGDISADGTQVCIGELGALDANGAYLVPYAATDKSRALHLGAGYPVAISPSGTRIVANLERADHLTVYSTSSGAMPEVPTPGFVTYGRWLDEESLVALFDRALWRLAIGKPPQKLVAAGGRFALDPARARGAFIGDDDRLRVFDTATGAVRTLPGTFARAEVCGWLAKPADAIAIRTTTTPIVVERVDPATGARTPHRTIEPPRLGLKAVDSLILHADGERVAYSYGEELSQLFVLAAS